jgi:flagellar FliL protein
MIGVESMANKDQDVLDERKGSKKTILIIAIGAIVLIAATAGGAMFFLSEDAVGTTRAGDPEAEEQVAAQQDPPIYFGLHPAMVVNFENPRGARFLQVDVEVMARSKEAIEAVKEHSPAIRNNLIMLFSSQDSEALKTRDGKEKLRQAALGEIQTILKKQAGEQGVEEVYFTSFVMQ